MKFIQNIKNKIGRWQLDRQIQHRKPGKLIPVGEMMSVGILYDAGKDENAVQEYAGALRVAGKKVFLMGFVNEKQLPPHKKNEEQSAFFWREQLTSVNLPDRGALRNFLDREFGLLLNLYFDPLLPLQAMSAFSKAHYKAGANVEGGLKYMDTLIDVGAKQDIPFLTQQIDFYLGKLS
jgi:hypothetical protein